MVLKMKKGSKTNIPLEDLSRDEQIDLVVVLGSFASRCKDKLQNSEDLSLKTILLSCLKLYDMNLLHAYKKKNKYTIKTTEIPISIVQHLVDTNLESEKEFLASRAALLANKFVELVESGKEVVLSPAPVPKKKKRKK